ncbi:MAG: hypothetical protein V3T53_06130 [Phycisphaerales bacterium]
MSDDTARKMTRRIRGGFTIVELLIVIAMIILLLSILIVAVNRASRTAQITNTRALMNSISQSLERFKEDVGYYPPVLGPDRELLDPLDPVALTPDEYRDQIQLWYSVTTLADYFIGYGDDQQDAYDGVGIRHPSPDAVWGATIYGAADGSLGARNAGTGPASAGKVYGPYLELKDERLLASTDGSTDSNGNLNVYFPGEGNYNDTDPKVITDYWGRPIRYYRTVYKPGAIKYPFRAAGLGDPVPSLADVFVLRPWEVKSGAETDSAVAEVGALGDTTATYALKTAAFVLFSAGPDRSLDQMSRFDVDDADGDGISGENEDNIVEVGP